MGEKESLKSWSPYNPVFQAGVNCWYMRSMFPYDFCLKNFLKLHKTLELSIKYTQLRVPDPNSSQNWRPNEKSGRKIVHMKKIKWEPNWFAHLNQSSQEFHPQFWIDLTCMPFSHCCSHSGCQNKTLLITPTLGSLV
jgi:hypothetical protein